VAVPLHGPPSSLPHCPRHPRPPPYGATARCWHRTSLRVVREAPRRALRPHYPLAVLLPAVLLAERPCL